MLSMLELHLLLNSVFSLPAICFYNNKQFLVIDYLRIDDMTL